MTRRIVISAMVLVACCSVGLRADMVCWDNDSGDGLWSTPANWYPDGVPTYPHWAVIGCPTYPIGSALVNSAVPSLRGVTLGMAPGNQGTLTVTQGAGTFTVDEHLYVGYQGVSIVTQTGGTVRAATEGSSYVSLGDQDGSHGTYNISGGALHVDNQLKVVRGALNVSETGTVTARCAEFGGGGSSTKGILQVPTTLGPGAISIGKGTPGQNDAVRWYAGGRLEVADSRAAPAIHLGGNWVMESADESDFEGLKHVELVFDDPGESGTFEVAGTMEGGFEDNFTHGKLSVVNGFLLRFVDLWDNGNRADFGKECLFTDSLSIDPLSRLDLDAYWMSVPGNQVDVLNSWIVDGRLFSSFGPIEAFYDSAHNWTYVPEPATLSALALGALTLLPRRRAGSRR